MENLALARLGASLVAWDRPDWSVLLSTFDITSFGWIHANAVPFIHKGRHGNGHAIFEQRRLVYVGNGRALHGRFSARHGQFHRRRQIDTDWRAFIKFRLD